MKSFLTIVSLFFVLVIVVFVQWHLDTPERADRERHKLLGGGSGVEERVSAIGKIKVAVAEEETISDVDETSVATVVAEESASVDGKQVYDSGCMACHGAGIAGAPRLGDAGAWTDRIASGMETMVAHAINGYQGSDGMMPAKGGNPALSDDEVRAAVEYMVASSQ